MVTSYSMAAEKKQLRDVDSDAFTRATQVMPQAAGDDHMALAWWIPNEFWGTILSRDTTTSESDKKAMLDTMNGVSLLAVIQADITQLGAFRFYTKEEIQRNMTLTFSDTGGTARELVPMQTIDTELEIVLGVFKPILGAAMGNLGNNMHFYVLNDRSESSRLMDPYEQGRFGIQLAKRDSSVMDVSIELPIDALYVPRKCPNGKDAHISWNYCPWSGTRLDAL